MTTTRDQQPLASPAASGRVYSHFTLADLLGQLGDVATERVRLDPAPGAATFEDLIRVNEQRPGPVCELVENTLVEKAMEFNESWLAFIIMCRFDAYLHMHDPGMCTAPNGVMKILPNVGQAPDVSFISWKSLPGGKPPARSEKVPAIVPDLVIEELSESNTPREMARKREEYFGAAVKVVWEINPESQAANIYTGPNRATAAPAGGSLECLELLPGFVLPLQGVFDRAERRS
jgi:Uma2 family endonuclease